MLKIIGAGLLELGDPRNAPAIQRLQVLLRGFQARHGDELAIIARGGKQWACIAACLSPQQTERVALRDSLGTSSQSQTLGVQAAGEEDGNKETSPWDTPPFVRLNPDIVNKPEVQECEDPVLLRCKACGALRRSRWMVRRRAKLLVLVPGNGHAGCTAHVSSKKERLFEPTSVGFHTITDHPQNFQACPHGMRTRCCFLCSPDGFCTEHGKKPVPRRKCRTCVAKGLVIRRPRVDTARKTTRS